MSSRFIHVGACVRISSFFKAEYSIVCIYILFIYLSIIQHLSCFHILAIVLPEFFIPSPLAPPESRVYQLLLFSPTLKWILSIDVFPLSYTDVQDGEIHSLHLGFYSFSCLFTTMISLFKIIYSPHSYFHTTYSLFEKISINISCIQKSINNGVINTCLLTTWVKKKNHWYPHS